MVVYAEGLFHISMNVRNDCGYLKTRYQKTEQCSGETDVQVKMKWRFNVLDLVPR